MLINIYIIIIYSHNVYNNFIYYCFLLIYQKYYNLYKLIDINS